MATQRLDPNLNPAPHVEDARDEQDVDALLEHVEAPTPEASRPALPKRAPVLRVARIAGMSASGPTLTFRGRGEPIPALLDAGVDPALVARAFAQGDAVLAEVDDPDGGAREGGVATHGGGGAPVIVGVVQRRLPAVAELSGQTVVIDAERELVLRVGRAAMRLREDGDVEVVGSRIVAMSRGLFRLVGQVLRLN